MGEIISKIHNDISKGLKDPRRPQLNKQAILRAKYDP